MVEIVIFLQNFLKINLIFSPCAASFDNFKNFEERGKYFNHLISRYKIKNARQ